jgi:hypothetical protein
LNVRPLSLCALVLLGCGPAGPLWEKSDTRVQDDLNALHGLQADDVWAVGASGAALHFDGTAWTKVSSGTTRTLRAVWAASSKDVWLVGDSGAVLRWNGATIQPVSGAPESESFVAVRGLSPSAVFLCAQNGLFFFDGTFHEFTRGGNGTSHVRCEALFELQGGVAALVEKDSVTSSEVMQLSATGGTVITLSGTINASFGATMFATGPSDFWLLNDNASSVKRFGGAMPTELTLPKNMSADFGFARAPTDVWLCGSQGMLAHWDGMGTEATLKVAGGFDAPSMKALWGQSGLMFAAGTKGWVLRLVE